MAIRPDFHDPYEAARVSTFMAPTSRGRWEIVQFTETQKDHDFKAAMLNLDGGERNALRRERLVPPGTYVSLRRKAIESEINDGEHFLEGVGADRMVPVMSDTPAEINGHREIIDRAYGRVLVTGLGLGCILSALLAKDEVSHVTVIEIDRDVIAMTGPYYEDNPRCTIINADALAWGQDYADGKLRTIPVMPDGRFDWAWHDIWTHISCRNLDERTAEHGISYQSLFDAYGPFCDHQGAWALDDAHRSLAIQNRERLAETEFEKRFLSADRDGRIEILFRKLIEERLKITSDGTPLGLGKAIEIPHEILVFFEQSGLREQAAIFVDCFEEDDWQQAKAERDDEEPLGRPNEVEEANVCR